MAKCTKKMPGRGRLHPLGSFVHLSYRSTLPMKSCMPAAAAPLHGQREDNIFYPIEMKHIFTNERIDEAGTPLSAIPAFLPLSEESVP